MTDLDLKMPKNRASNDTGNQNAGHEQGGNAPKARFVERRKIQRSGDALFRLAVVMNVMAWLILCVSLIVFHYARPEFIAGVQSYWGIEGRENWSQTHLNYLLGLLQACLVLSLITFFVRAKRNRRKSDTFGVNVMFLLTISIISLSVLYIFV